MFYVLTCLQLNWILVDNIEIVLSKLTSLHPPFKIWTQESSLRHVLPETGPFTHTPARFRRYFTVTLNNSHRLAQNLCLVPLQHLYCFHVQFKADTQEPTISGIHFEALRAAGKTDRSENKDVLSRSQLSKLLLLNWKSLWSDGWTSPRYCSPSRDAYTCDMLQWLKMGEEELNETHFSVLWRRQGQRRFILGLWADFGFAGYRSGPPWGCGWSAGTTAGLPGRPALTRGRGWKDCRDPKRTDSQLHVPDCWCCCCSRCWMSLSPKHPDLAQGREDELRSAF